MNDKRASTIWKMLEDMPLNERQSILARLLIHTCLDSQYPKEAMLEAISEQWDDYAAKYRAHYGDHSSLN